MEVTIRPLKEEDAYTSVKWRNDPDVFKYTGNVYQREIKIEDELAWIRKVTSTPNEFRCAILADDIYVGNIYLTDIHDSQATYHIFLGNKEYWGKGVAKKASVLLLDYAFSHLNLLKVNLKVRPANVRACLLYDSLGFIETSRDNEWISMSVKRKSS